MNRIHCRALLDRYDVFLIDAYGVLVNRDGALPGATDLIDELRRRHQPWLLVSNDASRLTTTTAARYQGFGLDIDVDHVLTSGMLLREDFAARGLAGRRVMVLGTDDSRRYVEAAGGELTGLSDEDAEVLVVADDDGYPFLSGIEQALTTVMRRMDSGRRTELILPNPDLIYPQGPDSYGLTSGSVALVIERALAVRFPGAGLTFRALGKPHSPMFEAAFRHLGDPPRDRVVMLGDQLATDILGASRFGIDSVLLATGLTRVPEALAESDVKPTWVMDSLG